MQQYDAVIVGGGPIGGHIAKKIAEKNYNVAIFEKNKQIGVPLNCAGLITEKVFNFLNFDKNKVIQNKIKGANIHSPSNYVLSIGGDKVHAVVIDRFSFDNEIINLSKKNGTEVFLKNKILSIQKSKGFIQLKTSKNTELKTNLIIGADGPYSIVRDRFGFTEPIEFLKGIGAELSGTNLDSNFVEIFVGRGIAPGFFAWIIPINEDGTKARIGLCVDQNAKYSPKIYFEKFLKNKFTNQFIKNSKIEKKIGGVIPLGVLKKTYDANVLIVGDAAAQIKPTSGGGIYPGLLCANYCSKVAIDALNKNDFSTQVLKKYQKLWSADIGRELFLGMKFRKIYKNLSDKQMDKYILKFSNSKFTDIITKYGDIDYPSKLVKPLLKKAPSLLKLIPSIIKE